MLKKCYFILFLLGSINSFAEQNSIVAIIGNEVVTKIELDKYLKSNKSNDSNLDSFINQKIVLNFARQKKITPTTDLINLNLLNFSNQNNISIDEIVKHKDFMGIKKAIEEKITIELVKDSLYVNFKKSSKKMQITTFKLISKISENESDEEIINLIKEEDKESFYSKWLNTQRSEIYIEKLLLN